MNIKHTPATKIEIENDRFAQMLFESCEVTPDEKRAAMDTDNQTRHLQLLSINAGHKRLALALVDSTALYASLPTLFIRRK